MVWGDPAPESIEFIPLHEYVITDSNGQSTRLDIDEGALRGAGGTTALNGTVVTVTGRFSGSMAGRAVESGSAAVFSVESILLSEFGPGADQSRVAPVVARAVSGSQSWISILCRFSDVVDEPKTLSYFQNMYGSTYPGLDHYWREASYDTVNVLGSGAVGWYTLPQPRSYYIYDANGDGKANLNHSRAVEDCTGVADDDVYFPNYVGINLMFNDDLDGYAWGGTQYLTLDGASKAWRTTWEPPWGYGNIGVIYHEMGHGFGLPHSSGNYGKTYDNVWDVMSAHWPYCYLTRDPTYRCLGQHTISYHKDKLGWIPSALKYQVAENELTSVTLERLAIPQSSSYRMIKIPIGGSTTHFYTVEVRRLAGYDQMVPGEALIIHEVDTTRGNDAHVIDVDGNGRTDDDGTFWTAGETFFDSANGILVGVTSATSTGFVVTVGTSIASDTISGDVLLPPGEVASTDGAYVDIYAEDQNGAGELYARTFISEGASSTPYTLLLPANSSSEWRVRYDCTESLSADGCAGVLDNGYYADSGTTGYPASSTLLPGSADYTGKNLTLLQDDDEDFVADHEDNCPGVANTGQHNFDQDGLGDECDPDDDNDGLTDVEESSLGTNPKDPDHDDDGIRDGLDESPTHFSIFCSGDVAVVDQIISALTQCAAPSGVNVLGGTSVTDPGNFQIITPRTILTPGFKIHSGGEMSIYSETLPVAPD